MKLFLDDFSVYSDVATHLPKVRFIFEQCRQYGVSLNLDKCIFYVPSGVILGYIVCQADKFLDPKKIEALVNMLAPKNVKAIQTFNGLAQFNQCFIKDYAGIMEPITRLTRKGEVFDWTIECENAYQYIKTRYQNAPILIGVDWKLEFHVHTNASDIMVGAMLAQNPTGKIYQPIAYASQLLSKAEKNYTTTEKEALAMVYAVNKFRHYLLSNRFIFYIDHLALQYLVNKPHVSGRLARWLILFLEFDFKVIYKPGKTHGVADALSRNKGAEPATEIPDQTTDAQLFSIQPDWIHPIIEYLQTGTFPPSMTKEAHKRLAYRAIRFQLVQGKLYRLGNDSRLRQVISDSQARMILQELHKGNAGGHFFQDNTVRKVLDAGYWWPTLYKDTYQYFQTCHECQKTGGLPKSVSTKLITTLPAEPFMKWGLDFVGPVKKTRHTGKRYILVATDYTTKWVEARALRTNSAQETAQFLYESILTRFGCPLHLVSDQGSHFLNGTIQVLTEHFLLRHTTSTTYYPQGNGQAESTNKVIVTMLQKLVNDNRTNWDIQLYTVLFSYRTAYKVATSHSPFELVYGLLPLMPTEYIVPTQRTTTDLDFTQHKVLVARTVDLDKLDETRLKAQTHQGQAQWNRAKWVQTQGKPH